ncbi:MAG TPA: carboxypeptidase-like regulatory domain-containing protein [Patescibacteria group bacterium]|nr:carboxypeptidase-like regulatory domain-containing protein [Patescibacteria group bacterium]
MFKKYEIKSTYSNSSRIGKTVRNWGYLAIVFVFIVLIWSGYFIYQNYYKTGKINWNSKVSGSVYSGDEPLYGVLIEVDKGLSVTSNEKGTFNISKVKFGKTKFTFSRDGYLPQVKEFFVWQKNMTLEKINLKRTGEFDSSYSGKVVNGFNKKPIAGAVITLASANRMSDESGNFLFSEMPKGDFTIKISAIGFNDFEESVSLDSLAIPNKEFTLTPYGKITFTSARSGKRDIYSISYDGKNIKDLTQKYKGDCWYASATADGKKIVFFSNMTGAYDEWGQKQSDLYVADNFGDSVRKINKNDIIPEEKYVISADGNSVAFFAKQIGSDKREIFLSDLAKGSKWIQLTDNDFTESDMAISPDGKIVAYEIINNEKREIVLINTENLDSNAISSDSSRVNFMAFLNDGKKLLYSRDSIDFGSRVFIYDLEKKKEEEVFKTYSDISNLALNPDNSKIVFTSRRDGKNAIYTFEIDGMHEVQISDVDEEYGNMMWPIEGILVFTVTSGDVNKLNAMNLSNRKMSEIEDVGDDAISWINEGFDKKGD